MSQQNQLVNTDEYKGSDEFALLMGEAHEGVFEFAYTSRDGSVSDVTGVPLFPSLLVHPKTGAIREYFDIKVISWESRDDNGDTKPGTFNGKPKGSLSLAVESMGDLELVNRVDGWENSDGEALNSPPFLYPQKNSMAVSRRFSAIDISGASDEEIERWTAKGNFGPEPRFLVRKEVVKAIVRTKPLS